MIAERVVVTTIDESAAESGAEYAGWNAVRGVRSMTTGEISPTPIHRALDRVTAAKLELQVLRRQLHGSDPLDPETLAAQFVQIDGWLDEIAAVLNDERDAKPRSANG